jgi:multidrug efflux pump subunit AcrA (membrane-fusion protein)
MRKNRANKTSSRAKSIATVIIILLTAICVLLAMWTFTKGRQPGQAQGQAVARGAGNQGEPGGQQGGPGQQSAPRGNAQGGSAGGQTGTSQRQQATGGAATGRAAVTVRTEKVILGAIENSVSVSGDVLAAQQVAIYPQTGGRITELRFRVGDSIRRGDVVARVDPSRPGEVYASSPVTSTITGTVLQAPYSVGDTVGTSSAIYAVGDLSSIIVETHIPERFSTSVRLGLQAAASFEALPGERFPMAVNEISPVLDPVSRTLRIRLQFQGLLDPRIRAGMYATVSLVTASRVNVPVVPRASLINTYGDWVVFTVDDANMAHRRVILIGLESEEFVEVASGLEAGEIVVSVGQNFLSDGELVRIVE